MFAIMIVGSGVVGTATGKGLLKHGHDVTFVDVNWLRLEALSYEGYDTAHLDNITDLNGFDAVFVSVTALTGDSGIDLTHLLAATRSLGEKLEATNGYPVIVYRCTMPPHTMRNTIVPLLEEISGKKAGVDFGVVYNPEFLRADTAEEDFLNPPAIVLSSLEENDRAHLRIVRLLEGFSSRMFWVPMEQAELLKYVNNVYNAFKITFFNFVRLVAEQMAIDPEQAFWLSTITCEGQYNPHYGLRNLGAFGGVCLPKDTEAFRYLAEQLGIDASLLSAVQAVNNTIAERA